MREPTAAPEPDEEPPGVWSGFQGLPVAVGSRSANGVVVTFPKMTAPAARRRATDAASAVARRCPQAPTPDVVTRPAAS